MKWYVFETLWGWSAILLHENRVSSSILPLATSLEDFLGQVKGKEGIDVLSWDNNSIPLVNRIRSYFQGIQVDTWEVELDLGNLPHFSRRVLKHVAAIPYGARQTYGEIASAMGNEKAARAVGQVMRRNPLPLIIPCHRVTARNGAGGFTAAGGIKQKKAMLVLEKEVILKTRIFTQ